MTARRILLTLAVLLFALAVFVQWHGGIVIRLGGLALRSRDPVRPLVASFALFLLVAAVDRVARQGAVARPIAGVEASKRVTIECLFELEHLALSPFGFSLEPAVIGLAGVLVLGPVASSFVSR
jgi:hypothetical protein